VGVFKDRNSNDQTYQILPAEMVGSDVCLVSFHIKIDEEVNVISDI
jgi:hypothetical protein